MASQVATSAQPIPYQNQIYLDAPLPFREMKIEANGEIFVKGKTLFKGYWNKDQTLSLPLENSWFPTKDVGVFDSKRGLAILGRKDHLFISGGENIYPEEIEEALENLPEIKKA